MCSFLYSSSVENGAFTGFPPPMFSPPWTEHWGKPGWGPRAPCLQGPRHGEGNAGSLNDTLPPPAPAWKSVAPEKEIQDLVGFLALHSGCSRQGPRCLPIWTWLEVGRFRSPRIPQTLTLTFQDCVSLKHDVRLSFRWLRGSSRSVPDYGASPGGCPLAPHPKPEPNAGLCQVMRFTQLPLSSCLSGTGLAEKFEFFCKMLWKIFP